MQGPDVRVALRHCSLCDNEASGLWVIAGGVVTAQCCDFEDNRCNGAAVRPPCTPTPLCPCRYLLATSTHVAVDCTVAEFDASLHPRATRTLHTTPTVHS